VNLLLVSFLGDQKTVIGQEYGDTDFVNDDFTANKKSFGELLKNLCEFFNGDVIIKEYDNATSVKFDLGKSFMSKNCQFSVTYYNDVSQLIRGPVFVIEENDEDDRWKESWEMKKKRFKSAEYIDNLGRVAIWNGKKRKLEIKMKGYVVTITVSPKMRAKNKLDNNTDVKNVAVAMAKVLGYFKTIQVSEGKK